MNARRLVRTRILEKFRSQFSRLDELQPQKVIHLSELPVACHVPEYWKAVCLIVNVEGPKAMDKPRRPG